MDTIQVKPSSSHFAISGEKLCDIKVVIWRWVLRDVSYKCIYSSLVLRPHSHSYLIVKDWSENWVTKACIIDWVEIVIDYSRSLDRATCSHRDE